MISPGDRITLIRDGLVIGIYTLATVSYDSGVYTCTAIDRVSELRLREDAMLGDVVQADYSDGRMRRARPGDEELLRERQDRDYLRMLVWGARPYAMPIERVRSVLAAWTTPAAPPPKGGT